MTTPTMSEEAGLEALLIREQMRRRRDYPARFRALKTPAGEDGR